MKKLVILAVAVFMLIGSTNTATVKASNLTINLSQETGEKIDKDTNYLGEKAELYQEGELEGLFDKGKKLSDVQGEFGIPKIGKQDYVSFVKEAIPAIAEALGIDKKIVKRSIKKLDIRVAEGNDKLDYNIASNLGDGQVIISREALNDNKTTAKLMGIIAHESFASITDDIVENLAKAGKSDQTQDNDAMHNTAHAIEEVMVAVYATKALVDKTPVDIPVQGKLFYQVDAGIADAINAIPGLNNVMIAYEGIPTKAGKNDIVVATSKDGVPKKAAFLSLKSVPKGENYGILLHATAVLQAIRTAALINEKNAANAAEDYTGVMRSLIDALEIKIVDTDMDNVALVAKKLLKGKATIGAVPAAGAITVEWASKIESALRQLQSL